MARCVLVERQKTKEELIAAQRAEQAGASPRGAEVLGRAAARMLKDGNLVGMQETLPKAAGALWRREAFCRFDLRTVDEQGNLLAAGWLALPTTLPGAARLVWRAGEHLAAVLSRGAAEVTDRAQRALTGKPTVHSPQVERPHGPGAAAEATAVGAFTTFADVLAAGKLALVVTLETDHDRCALLLERLLALGGEKVKGLEGGGDRFAFGPVTVWVAHFRQQTIDWSRGADVAVGFGPVEGRLAVHASDAPRFWGMA